MKGNGERVSREKKENVSRSARKRSIVAMYRAELAGDLERKLR